MASFPIDVHDNLLGNRTAINREMVDLRLEEPKARLEEIDGCLE